MAKRIVTPKDICELTETYHILTSVDRKLMAFYVLLWVAMDKYTRKVALPKNFVVEALRLKDARVKKFYNHLINLQLIREDLSWDCTPKAIKHYIVNPFELSLVPSLRAKDINLIQWKPLLEDPLNIEQLLNQPVYTLEEGSFSVRHMYRSQMGRAISINGISQRAKRRNLKKLVPMKYSGMVEVAEIEHISGSLWGQSDSLEGSRTSIAGTRTSEKGAVREPDSQASGRAEQIEKKAVEKALKKKSLPKYLYISRNLLKYPRISATKQ